jgi:hypothetical protein
VLSDRPKPPKGDDNLKHPLHDVPATTEGGWRTSRYKAFEAAARLALAAIAAAFLVRRLARRT